MKFELKDICFFDCETTGVPAKGLKWDADFNQFPHVVQLAWAFGDRDRAMCGYTHAEPTNLEDKQDEAKQQVIEWGLPPAPAKETDSRTANWDGLGQVELDAVKPEKLIALLDDAINEIFDQYLYDELIATEAKERELFQAELKRYVEEDL